MVSVDRIRTAPHVTAMVALDTTELLAARVARLVSHGRRIAIAHRYATYTQQPPQVRAGLVVVGKPVVWVDGEDAGMDVDLDPAPGFGFRVFGFEGNVTEVEALRRHDAAKAVADRLADRRRSMTYVEITGGRAEEGPTPDDRIVIMDWNIDGVCSEKVIAFDPGPGRG